MTLTIYGIKEWGLALIATLLIEAGAGYLISIINILLALG